MIWAFELLCLALASGAVYRSLSVGSCLTPFERLTLTGIASAAFYGIWKPVSGWQPDDLHFFLAITSGAYLLATAQAHPAEPSEA